MLDGKSILVTGGTGSFGRECCVQILRQFRPERLIVFSRDELKQSEMAADPALKNPAMRYFLGDVRDRDRLERAMRDVDLVIHAAALKQVPAAEYNPHEFIKTNINGATNVVDAALSRGVPRVIALSTDKAVNPINLYGATKLCSDKIFVAGNSYSGKGGTLFSVVRYGNVIGSRGSVIPFFLKQLASGSISLTHPEMTRFLIPLSEGVRFALDCAEHMVGGEIFIPKIPSCRMGDLAEAMTNANGTSVKIVGVRPGEKMHEVLIPEDDARHTLEFKDKFIIQPVQPFWTDRTIKLGGRKAAEGFSYTSDNNPDRLSIAQLRTICGAVARDLGLPPLN